MTMRRGRVRLAGSGWTTKLIGGPRVSVGEKGRRGELGRLTRGREEWDEERLGYGYGPKRREGRE